MNEWMLLCALLLGSAWLAVMVLNRRYSRPLRAAAALAGVVAMLAVAFWKPDTEDEPPPAVPRKVKDGGYVTSQSCQSCHPEQHQSWHDSFHRTMTQLPTPQTVVAPFDDVELESRGRRYRLERRGDEFWVTMPDPAWEAARYAQGMDLRKYRKPPQVTRKVVLTTGSHHMQTYWVSSREGPEGKNVKLRHVPWYYHIAGRRWIPSEDSFLKPPGYWRDFDVWNLSCINCHSVAGNPGVDVKTRHTASTVAEFGIACEACHGPGDEHVRFHLGSSTGKPPAAAEGGDPTIVNPARLSHEAASQVCAQCHSHFSIRDMNDWRQHGLRSRPGDDIGKSRRLTPFDPARTSYHNGYWGDGTQCVGGDEYLGISASGCYQRGELSCLSCHSMHASEPSDQLAAGMQGDRACTQCHADVAERIEAHTHHHPDSSGSRCYNCHMPHTTYALFTAMRSHRIDSPSAEVLAGTDRPNACNQCHLDRTLQWTAKHLSDWYGQPAVELSEEEQQTAASALWLLRGHALQRALTAWTMGWKPAHEASGNQWQAPLLARLLEDPYSAVRYVAFNSLRKLPGYEDFEYDFTGPAADRSGAAQRALQIWNADENRLTGERGQALLRDEAGKLRKDLIDQLLQQRDETPIEVSE